MAIQWKLNDVICISYNTAVRDLPDIYAQAQGHIAPKCECI